MERRWTLSFRETIGFIGGGNMAEALLGGILKAGIVQPEGIMVSEPAEERRRSLAESYGVRVTADNREAAAEGSTVFLAVKPQVLPGVLDEIAAVLTSDRLVVSIAAGITLAFLEERLPDIPLVRSMPNTPALVGYGATVISPGQNASADMTHWAVELFHSVGICMVLSEDLMDAVTGLSGSGPAYVFRLAESMFEAGTDAGIPAEQAAELVTQTILGAAWMMRKTGRDPGELRRTVTSPGGTTEAGLAAMAKAGFEEAVAEGVAAAVKRAEELGRSSG